jgi:glucose/arabinose dehydrogenase
LWSWAAAIALLLAGSAIGRAQELGADLIADFGLTNFGTQSVTAIHSAPGRPNDLFVGILDGRILRVDLTDNSVSTFATIPDIDQTGATGFFGLHGFTFHPDFATNGQLYVHVADDRNVVAGVHHRNYIRRYDLANPLAAAPTLGAGTNILRMDQPRHDHNGGFLGFQPGDNNTLWISTGDGGNNDANPDPSRTGQNPNDLLGSILRVDITGDAFPADPERNYKIPANNPFANGVGGLPEVWSYGIRSPWGGSFDRATGDFVFGDVGQITREEVNFERAGSAGGRNYGWRVMEGSQATPNIVPEPGDLPPNDPSFTSPVYEYIHTGAYGGGNSDPFTGRSITGGNIYRGPIAELQGKYIFGDWSSRQVWAVTIDRNANGGLGGIVPGSQIDLGTALRRDEVYGGNGGFGDGVTAFGEDNAGNLYFAELDGSLFKVCLNCGPAPEQPPTPMEPALTLRDDFNGSFNYQSGSVPAAGIWTDAHNANFGDTFNANTTNAGQLTMGMEPVGWQGNGEHTAPFLFREVPAENLAEVRVRISSQTRGNWSSAGVLVRVAGPLDDVASNDNFLSAHSFQGGDSLQTANVRNNVENEGNVPVSVDDLEFLRMVNRGKGEFEIFTSPDGNNWTSRTTVTNDALATGMLEVGLWAGSYGGGISNGDTQFDWAEIILGVPAGDFNEDGTIDAADYTVWRDTRGTSVTAWSGADGNGDGLVDDADYDVWQQNFGLVIPDLAGAAAAATVPEPSAWALIIAAASTLPLGWRRVRMRL